jgi:hypothetical protein
MATFVAPQVADEQTSAYHSDSKVFHFRTLFQSCLKPFWPPSATRVSLRPIFWVGILGLGTWRENVGRHLLNLDFKPRHNEPFQASIKPLFAHDSLRVGRNTLSAHCIP